MGHIDNYDELNEQFTTTADAAQLYLAETDYIIIRALELGEAIPADIKAKRQEARQTLAENRTKKQDLWDLDNIELFTQWATLIGTPVEAKKRVQDDGILYECIQAHIPQSDWHPADTPALWAKVSVVEWPEIPENIPSTAPWMSGDKGTWKEHHYICQMDNCVWNPDQYAAAWLLVE